MHFFFPKHSNSKRHCTRNPAFQKSPALDATISRSGDDDDKKGRNDALRGGDEAPALNSGGVLVKIYRSYLETLDAKPVITKSITTGIIMGVGDVLSQAIESGGRTNIARMISFVISGIVFVGPFTHYMYEFLWNMGVWLENKFGTPKRGRTLTQVVVDQTLGVAAFFPAYFYVYEIIEAFTLFRLPVLANATTKIKKEMISVLLMQYKIWPLANYVNFAFVPLNLQVLFGNIVALFWNIFLCMKVA